MKLDSGVGGVKRMCNCVPAAKIFAFEIVKLRIFLAEGLLYRSIFFFFTNSSHFKWGTTTFAGSLIRGGKVATLAKFFYTAAVVSVSESCKNASRFSDGAFWVQYKEHV